jgi:translation initiation factor IF-2
MHPHKIRGLSNWQYTQILHSGIGQLTPNDVNLAVASGAHVVSFNLGANNATLEKVRRSANIFCWIDRNIL